LTVNFAWKKSAADEEIVRDFVLRRLPAKETTQVPNPARVEQQGQEKYPTPNRKGSVRPFAEDSVSAFDMGDSQNQKIDAQPDHEKEPATMNDPWSNQSQTKDHQY